MSYSWVDPHFAALYARREEERLVERLATRLRTRVACEPSLDGTPWRGPAWIEQDVAVRCNIRLI